MKKIFLFTSVLAIILTGCKSASYQAKSAHTENLGKTVLFVPTLAELSVASERVTATLNKDEVAGLSLDKAKQTVAAKALSGTADILVAPQYETSYFDGDLQNISVVGYAATFKSFRPMKVTDAPFVKTEDVNQNTVITKPGCNTQTIADLKVADKVTLTLSDTELQGLSENKALALAKSKILRQQNADFLLEVQYEVKNLDGELKSFTATAYPAYYTNYRTATKAEVKALNPTSKAQVYYNLVAEVKALGDKLQKTYPASTFKTVKAAELKELARIQLIKDNNADILLNDQYYFDYDAEGKIITAVTVCGTPAVYANFHSLNAEEVIDRKTLENADGATSQVSFLQMILNLFKKK